MFLLNSDLAESLKVRFFHEDFSQEDVERRVVVVDGILLNINILKGREVESQNKGLYVFDAVITEVQVLKGVKGWGLFFTSALNLIDFVTAQVKDLELGKGLPSTKSSQLVLGHVEFLKSWAVFENGKSLEFCFHTLDLANSGMSGPTFSDLLHDNVLADIEVL